MIKCSCYFLRRPNGKWKKPQLSYSRCIMCNDVTLKDCGYLYEIVIGWLVIHVLQYS